MHILSWFFTDMGHSYIEIGCDLIVFLLLPLSTNVHIISMPLNKGLVLLAGAYGKNMLTQKGHRTSVTAGIEDILKHRLMHFIDEQISGHDVQ